MLKILTAVKDVYRTVLTAIHYFFKMGHLHRACTISGQLNAPYLKLRKCKSSHSVAKRFHSSDHFIILEVVFWKTANTCTCRINPGIPSFPVSTLSFFFAFSTTCERKQGVKTGNEATLNSFWNLCLNSLLISLLISLFFHDGTQRNTNLCDVNSKSNRL